MIGKKKCWSLFCFWKSPSRNRYEEGERKKKNSYLSKTPATFSSRLESLNISEKGLICSLLNLSPLRKSMALSIRLLISSGPEWTCKACARWFGSRFIEFLVRAARVYRGKAHAHRMNLLVPLFLFHSSYKWKRKNRHSYVHYIHKKKREKIKGKGREGKIKMQRSLSDRASHALIHSQRHVHFALMLVVTKACNYAHIITRL